MVSGIIFRPYVENTPDRVWIWNKSFILGEKEFSSFLFGKSYRYLPIFDQK